MYYITAFRASILYNKSSKSVAKLVNVGDNKMVCTTKLMTVSILLITRSRALITLGILLKKAEGQVNWIANNFG